MDDFKRSTTKTIGPGGLKCRCCNPYRRGMNMRKVQGLSRLRRSRLKQADRDFFMHFKK